MAYEQREGQGSLFTNKKKEEGSSQPDRNGTLMLNGKVYEVSGWLKTAASGLKYLSLSIKLKDERPRQEPPSAALPEDLEDDIPF